MKLSDFKKRDKIIAAAAGGAVFIFIIGNFVFSTARSRIQVLRRQIKLEEANLKSGIEIENRKAEIIEDLNRYKEALNAAQNISEQEVMAVFLKEIERIAQESHISIVALSPQGRDENVKERKKYNAELRAEGTQESIYLFLYNVQTSRLFIKLDKVSITMKGPQRQLLRIDAIISLTLI